MKAIYTIFVTTIVIIILSECPHFFEAAVTLKNTGRGLCPRRKPKNPDDLNMRTLGGNWYEYSTTTDKPKAKCVAMALVPYNDTQLEALVGGDVIAVDSTFTSRISFHQDEEVQAKIIPTYHEEITYAGLLGIFVKEYYVLSTDYYNYLVFWGCTYLRAINTHSEYVWIFSRRRIKPGSEEEKTLLAEVRKELKDVGVLDFKYSVIDNSGDCNHVVDAMHAAYKKDVPFRDIANKYREEILALQEAKRKREQGIEEGEEEGGEEEEKKSQSSHPEEEEEEEDEQQGEEGHPGQEEKPGQKEENTDQDQKREEKAEMEEKTEKKE